MQHLPASLVDVIFARLTMTYGRDFMDRWPGIEPAAVKASWGLELAGFGPEAVYHALDNLPPAKPPTALEFKAACARAPAPAGSALPNNPTPADPAIARQALQAMRSVPAGAMRQDLDWAASLRDRHRAGEKLNPNQIRCFRNALRLHPNGAQV